MTSKSILKGFLIENKVDPNEVNLINDQIDRLNNMFDKNIEQDVFAEVAITIESDKASELNTDIVYNIITDMYELNRDLVKQISKQVEKSLKIKFGREEKGLIKQILDYDSQESLDLLQESFQTEYELIVQIIRMNRLDRREEAIEKFVNDWNSADILKKKNYLYSLYLRLYHLNEMNNIKLIDIYRYNEDIIKKELNKKSIFELKQFCENDITSDNIKKVSKKFYNKYITLLKNELQVDSVSKRLTQVLNVETIDQNFKKEKYILDRGQDLKLFETEEYDSIYLTINQEMYNRFNSYDEFYDYILTYINESYRVLCNNKVFSMKIENIYDQTNKNLKWDLYSKLCIYGEHFIPIEMPGNFYKPEEIVNDMLYIEDKKLSEEDKNILKKYYKGKLSFEELIQNMELGYYFNDKKEYLDKFKYAYFGFTFTDCFILRKDEEFPNPQLNYVENNTELLLTFYKYRIDNRKIPCPECGGLKVSGNSFPEIGHRSWECKNEICPSRSKSNRGKRYSEKSNYMQWGTKDKRELNCISRELIKKWRKDIVNISNESEIYEMIIKYFSFPNEKILMINSHHDIENHGRNITYLNNIFPEDTCRSYTSDIYIDDSINNIYDEYFNNGPITSNFIIDKELKLSSDLDLFLNNKSENIKLVNGDSFKILQNISDNTIKSAVTSPPYYNAREYSQWNNLYLYLYDMYNIIKQCFRTMKPGGVFLYNIGDISDNEKIIAKSVMGQKRIPLGAYSIYLFEKAGFEIVENIIWDKGETQSNRHKNDGKFTPHYQKPINSYEHMFIFKKPGENIEINVENIDDEDIWKRNITLFSPVIKINSKGENLYGHTAPYPKDIPEFVAKCFNRKGDIMLDPFSGSLTSAIVANQQNLIGLAIESCNDFVDLSIKKAKSEGIAVDLEIYTESSNIKI